MTHYRSSDYALNRERDCIVYRFADSVVEISVEEFLSSYPDQTEQDFYHWKQISDQMYLDEKRANWRNSHRNVSLCHVENVEASTLSSAEDDYFRDIEQEEEKERLAARMALAAEALSKLKLKQRRRFLLYAVHQLSMREIARLEGVSHVSVHLSIQSARKKIAKYLEGHKRVS